jgi:hypothetical protein
MQRTKHQVREINEQAFIEEVYESHEDDGGVKFVFFIGAGCSVLMVIFAIKIGASPIGNLLPLLKGVSWLLFSIIS